MPIARQPTGSSYRASKWLLQVCMVTVVNHWSPTPCRPHNPPATSLLCIQDAIPGDAKLSLRTWAGISNLIKRKGFMKCFSWLTPALLSWFVWQWQFWCMTVAMSHRQLIGKMPKEPSPVSVFCVWSLWVHHSNVYDLGSAPMIHYVTKDSEWPWWPSCAVKTIGWTPEERFLVLGGTWSSEY